MMENGLLKFRIFLEGLFLGAGGFIFFCIIEMLCAEPFNHLFGTGPKSDDILHGITIALLLAAGIWILSARRKTLGDRIGTGAFIFLTLLPFILLGGFLLMFLSSFD